MNRAYVVEIAPNRFQASMCDKSAHAARAIWNWGLATSNAHYRDFSFELKAVGREFLGVSALSCKLWLRPNG